MGVISINHNDGLWTEGVAKSSIIHWHKKMIDAFLKYGGNNTSVNLMKINGVLVIVYENGNYSNRVFQSMGLDDIETKAKAILLDIRDR